MDNGVRSPITENRVPRNFSGNEEVWKDYWKHYHGVAVWNIWDDADKAGGLHLAFTDHASDYIYSQAGSDGASYQELCSLLENRFGADRCLAMAGRMTKQTPPWARTY